MSELDGSTGGTSILFTYVPWYKHLWLAMGSHWATLVATFATIFGFLWALVDATTYFLEKDLSGAEFYVRLTLVAFAGGLIGVAYRYSLVVPSGWENETPSIQRTVHWKRPRWEVKLALLLLRERVSETDRRLQDLEIGRRYVGVSYAPEVSAYMAWLLLRPANLVRMADVAKLLIEVDLPASLSPRGEGNEVAPEAIRECIDAFRDLYNSTLDFEIESHKIEPPDGFEKVHQIQAGWTRPIRDGLVQIMDFFEKAIVWDLKSGRPLTFPVGFSEPEGLQEFEEELRRLGELHGLGDV